MVIKRIGDGDARLDRSLLRLGAAAFALLGAQAGAWAVLLADLARVAGVGAPRLGLALTALACVAVPSVLVAGRVVDRLGRRTGVVVGCCGSGAAFAALSTVDSFGAMLGLFLLFGVVCSLYDVVVNVLGGDHERRTGRVTMPRLHAVFSAGGAVGALGSALALSLGAGHRSVCVAVGALLVLLGVAGAVTPLPPAPAASGPDSVRPRRRGPLTALALPGVGLATALVTLQFFNDGAVEGYSSVYLRQVLSAGALVGGVGIAAFHAATMVGRLVADRATGAFGEGRVIVGGGLVASLGYAVALGTGRPLLVVAGLLLAGLGAAPIVPLAYSLAARHSGPRSGEAASVVTAFGYVSFVVAPAAVGSLAAVADLRRALLCLVFSAALISLVGHRTRRPADGAGTHRIEQDSEKDAQKDAEQDADPDRAFG